MKESDGEKGNKKHLPSLLESTAVIMEQRHSKRGGGKEQRDAVEGSHTQCTLTKGKDENEKHTLVK